MTKSCILASVASIFVLGCATDRGASKVDESEPKSKVSASADSPCVANFSIQGGFWAGQKISTFQEFPTKTVAGAFDILLPAIATRGFQIVSSSKEAGLISASSGVGWSRGGKTIPLNVTTKKLAPSGGRVDIVLFASGGLVTHNEQIQAGYCELMALVAQSPDGSAATPAATPGKQPATPQSKPKSKN